MPPKKTRAVEKLTTGTTQLRWTAEMDAFLAQVLLEDVVVRGRRGNNGMRTETVKLARAEVARKFDKVVTTGNIQNRIKGLKKDYHAARDAIHSSGFGVMWDGEKKCITVDPASWDEYVQAHPQAQGLRDKCFPLYEAIYAIYGHDDAAGTESFTAPESEHQGTTPTPIPSEHQGTTPTPIPVDDDNEEETTAVDGEVGVEAEVNSPVRQTRARNKRRREPASSVVNPEQIDTFNDTLLGLKQSVSALCEDKERAERVVMWDELASVEGLLTSEQYEAATLFHREPKLLSGFLTTLEKHKLGYLRHLLNSI